MGQTSCKNFIRARPPADTGAVRPSNTINKRLISALAGCPPLKCTFYYETQVFVQQLQLPLLYDLPGPGRSGTMLKELEMELREKLKLAVGSSVFAVVPADELYSPPYPLAMINVVAARLYSRTENIHVPVLHFALVVRNMALLSQPILKGYAYESPFCAVRASLLADSSNSVARTLSRRRFVNILQNFGFARLEVTPEQARIPSDAFDRVRVWLTKQLNLPKEKRWNEYVNESHEEEENVDKNAGNRLNASYSSVSRGRRVGFSRNSNREFIQLRLPITASGTPWPPPYFQDDADNEDFANEMMTLLELLDNVSRDCMKAVCEVLNIDERWVFDELLDDLTRPTPDLQGHRSTNYKYGASVLRIYNYHNKAVKDQASSKDDQSDDLCGVHADIGLVTVSPLATVPGLQIWNLERMVWADVEDSAAPLHFSVFAGETLGLLTHGVISAPLHRVPSIYIKNEAERRMSMPYFLRAMPDACLNPKAPIDDHITCRDFVENILHKNRPWRQSDPNNHAPPDY